MYAAVNTSITILSGLFAMFFLLVMGLFVLSNLLLKFNRDRLVRAPYVSLPHLAVAAVVVGAAVGGNVAQSPVIVGWFAVFFVVAWVAMRYTGWRGGVAILVYWIYQRNTSLHSWSWTRGWHIKLIAKIKKAKKQPVVFFAKTDEVLHQGNHADLEISVLNEAIDYINRSECTSILISGCVC
jgi:hypothetical protein